MGWQVGDLALCVKIGPWKTVEGPHFPCLDPEPGSINTVVELSDCVEGPSLGLDGFGAFYLAARFRKITPGAKIEGVEERRRLPVREDA